MESEENTSKFCKVKYKPITDKRKYSAYLASFSNGRLRKRCRNKFQLKSFVLEKTVDGLQRKKVRKILVANTNHLDYSGANYGTGLTQQGETCKFSLGVLNKRTNKMKLYDLNLMHMKPVLETTINDNVDDDKFYSEKLNDLTEAFGSKHKKRLVRSKIRYKVVSANDSVILAAVNAASISDTPSATNQDIIVPPRNENASAPEQVYDLYDVIAKEVYDELNETAEILRSLTLEDIEQHETKGSYSRYVLTQLRKNRNNITLHNAKLLTYYDYLVKFSKLNYKQLRQSQKIFPHTLWNNFIKLFTVASTTEEGLKVKSFPMQMKNKLMMHAMVLALFIEDFEFEVALFQSDFKVLPTRANKLAYALGCHIRNRKLDGLHRQIAQLCIPLFVAKPFRNRKTKM